MLEYQERVVDEKAALNAKIEKLDKFIDGDIFKELSDDEQERMVRQRLCMNEYSKILSERISAYCLKDIAVGDDVKKVDLINNGRFVVSITGISDEMCLLVRNIIFNGNTMRINFFIDGAVQEFLCRLSEETSHVKKCANDCSIRMFSNNRSIRLLFEGITGPCIDLDDLKLDYGNTNPSVIGLSYTYKSVIIREVNPPELLKSIY